MRATLLLSLLLVGCTGLEAPSDKTDGEDTAPSGSLLSFNVSSVDFGEIEYGEHLSTTFTVSNGGGADLIVSSITTVDPFSVSPGFLTLPAGGSSAITLFVQPTAYGDFAADLTFTTDNPDLGTGGVVTLPLTASTNADLDGDGFDTVDAGGTDCDDADATINTDADETWYDGVDQNCDGLNDYDRDADGYDAETDDHEVSAGMADCNDGDTEYYPGAADEPYDNKDTNCDDSNDWDYDDDGYESLAYGRGSDCDDFDATVNRDGVENFNGKDDDCDGSTDNDALAEGSSYIYAADGTYDRAGYSVAVGDLDADGTAEVVVGAPYVDAANASAAGRGGVAVFLGGDLLSTGTAIDRADNWFDGDNSTDLLGNYVTVMGDFDGDGVNELAVSATGTSSSSGTVYLLGGEDASTNGNTGDAITTFTGNTSSYFGRGIGTDIDMNSDGMDELVVMYASGSNNCIALQYGDSSPSSTASVTTMDAKWSTDGTEVAFYRNAPVGGDLDGDGYDDLVLSDGKADDTGYTDNGVMWVLWGQSTEYYETSTSDIETDASIVIRGGSSSAYAAWSTQLGEDWDGDGDNELWVYNSGEGLYVIEGGTDLRGGILDPATDYAVSYVWNASSPDAEMIRRAGDWDGDGVSDMMVFIEDESGAYGLSELFPSSNRTGVYAEQDDNIGSLTGSSDHNNGNVGYGLSPKAGDIDGDGSADMVVGDAEYSSNAGEAYVLLNGSGAGE